MADVRIQHSLCNRFDWREIDSNYNDIDEIVAVTRIVVAVG